MERFQIQGLICPVFTPFTQDKKCVNFEVIDKYGNHLKSKGIQCVLVNGVTGEGTCLRIDERKRLAEEWLKVCRKYGIKMVLCIGGCGIADVYDLCEHAEKIGVDCITLLPDLFYKPKIEGDLVEYFKYVCKHCPTRPVYYFHIPEYTKVHVNILRFYELIGKSCTNFCGVFYRCGDVELAYDLHKTGCHVILCTDTLLPGVMTLGFNTFCMISLNVCTDSVHQIYEHMCNSKLREAYDVYNKYYTFIKEICNNQVAYCDWVEVFKCKFNKVVDFNVGGVRKPHVTFPNKKY